MAKNNILISACLLGDAVRYDGHHKQLNHTILQQWSDEGRLLKLCPEVSGGLSVPRLPAEIQSSSDCTLQVVDIAGHDVTAEFQSGANNTLQFCQQNNIKMAILTEGSPSCGSSKINDGQFKHHKISGEGITTRLLRKKGIQVFSQSELDQASVFFQKTLLDQDNKK